MQAAIEDALERWYRKRAREEVAVRARMSTDYYTRLEQGRIRPSASVLASLARVLRLDELRPELVSLPYGAYVHPHGTGPQMGGGGVYVNATITGGDSWSTSDRRAFAREFAEAVRDGVDIVYTSHGA